MFEDCINLLSFTEYTDFWENSDIIDMKYMFNNLLLTVSIQKGSMSRQIADGQL